MKEWNYQGKKVMYSKDINESINRLKERLKLYEIKIIRINKDGDGEYMTLREHEKNRIVDEAFEGKEFSDKILHSMSELKQKDDIQKERKVKREC